MVEPVMASSTPAITSGYRIDLTAGSFDGLRLDTSLPVASLGPHDCLVAIHAVSLNYRDIAMPLRLYPAYTKEDVVPCSDGAGVVVAVGSQVESLKVGDKVCPTFFQDFEDGYPTKESRATSLGGLNDGVLRKHAVFGERGLIKLPGFLSAREASTLPCAALTAWNTLFGVEGRALKRGDWVLTQGSGGVSIFALLFAKALGAHVVATTGDKGKEKRLHDLGADLVLNYREDPKWGIAARDHIEKQGGTGAQHIIEVAGETSMEQSLKAVAPEGIISIIGFLGGAGTGEKKTGFWDCFTSACLVRGVLVGSKRQFRDMLAFMEEKAVRPVIDEKVWRFEQAREAYEYFRAQKFFGKVVIDVEGVAK
ncbi:Alcohol dehydrogenase GroES-like domain-containing protein [Cladophialophora immunda]|nr:Alcohol dehydrogenase GroES-like domain-containing protein [Cladophialophora immunda]